MMPNTTEAEAVRIEKTGAHRILNSKGMFNRCTLPRIVAKDNVEEVNLGVETEKKEDGEVKEIIEEESEVQQYGEKKVKKANEINENEGF